MGTPSLPPMADAPYLIALALLEQDGRRALPLQGTSLPEAPADGADPGEPGRRQALELLVRVWQRSEAGPLRRAAADSSLLLATVPMDCLLDTLPALKARWIAQGDAAALIRGLLALGGRVWRVSLESRQPLAFEELGGAR